jgi:acyl-CoA thioesterase FadM
MNLYFRLFITLLKTCFKPRIAVGDTIECTFRVWPNDLDINAHMNNGRYLTIVDLALIEYFIRCGFLGTMIRRGWRPMLGGAMIHFRRGLQPFQRYTLRFRLSSWDERWNYMTFEFVRDGKVAAGGVSKGAVVGPQGFVGNAAAYAAMGLPDASPAEPEIVSKWRAADLQLMNSLAA